MQRIWIDPGLSPRQVVFLTGAGISADAPTNGPVGLELTRRAIDHAYWDGTAEELRDAYLAVEPNPPRELPRLEAVLEVAVRAHGESVLVDLLSDLATAAPNALHEFFAMHLDAGGAHITANFDTLIDDHAQSTNVLHFHGALKGADPYATIGATLSRIEHGFEEPMRQQLRTTILAPNTRELVVVGYSGLDFFDMDPYMVTAAPTVAANGTRVVWVDHDFTAAPEKVDVSRTPDSRWPPMLLALQRAGVECVRFRGLTSTVLDSYAGAFGFPPIRTQPRGESSWSQPPSLADASRLDATRRLYLHLGLHRSLERLISKAPFLAATMSSVELAEMAWQVGDHRRALKHWRIAFRGPEPARRGRRLEREAACLWDRGSYARSFIVANRAARVAAESGDPTTIALCLEMRARILNHMRRTPELRWFVTRRRLADVLDEIPSLQESILSLNIRTRLRDVAALLEFDPEAISRDPLNDPPLVSVTAEGAEIFNQYESLSALLDYRRGSQRRQRAFDGRPIQEEWLRTYVAGARFLGKVAAEKTVAAMPGASSHFTLSEAVVMLSSAPGTIWHRVRMFGRYLYNRMLRAERYPKGAVS